ncbi:MAG: RNA polymerase sigma factor [Planctomycetota bacterium]
MDDRSDGSALLEGDEGEATRTVRALAEARLFARAAQGDRAALDEVWRANRRWVASVVAAHAPRGADLEDILQDVAATLVAKCRHVRDAGSLRGWLRVVAVNAARMWVRSAAAERRALRAVAALARVADAGDHQAEVQETLARIARLAPAYAEPLMLQVGQGLSQREIAELLDVPETTVETRLARARRMLRQMAREDGIVRQETMR